MDLSAIRQVLEKMHDPQTHYPSILVGGTNGKGSICAMASSILASAGLKVGLYTSPHLIDVRERIRFNGRMITAGELAACIEDVRSCAADTLTYFEFLTAVAFLFFSRKKIDIAVLEVGMGGRLDATNVVRPIVSAISNISLEHSAYLGKRLAQIAFEKAGIIKNQGICITAATQKPVVEVLEAVSRERHAVLHRLGQTISVRAFPPSRTFSYRGLDKTYANLPCPLLGRHQLKNAAVAVGIMEILTQSGWRIDEQAIRRGLAGTRWAGRLEVLQKSPQVVLDGAHNPAGVAVLCRALKDDFTYDRLIVVCGVLNDKKFKDMVKRLAVLADILILTQPTTDRALVPAEMLDVAIRNCRHVQIKEDPREALSMAMATATPADLICVTGSLYLVGEIKAAMGHTA